MVNVLRELKRKGEQVDLGYEEERLDVFFRHMYDVFREGYEMTATSLKIFSWKKVNDTDLADVYKIFFLRKCEEPTQFPTHSVQCFQSVGELLHKFPDGCLVARILQFWIDTFPNDLEKAELMKLLDLFTGLFIKQSAESVNGLKEKADRLLHYIMKIIKASLIVSWPKAPEFLEVFKRSAYSFLDWISQQVDLSEYAKENTIALFVRCFDRMERCEPFSCQLIKSLCLCKGLSLEYRETFLEEIINFSTHLDENEKDLILAFVSKVSTSSQTLDSNQEVFSELSETLNRLIFKNKRLTKQTRSKTFQLIMNLAKAPLLSVKTDNVVRLIRHSRNLPDGLSCCEDVLRLATSVAAIVKERAEEYFEILFSAVFETLNGSKPLCEVFSIQHQNMTKLHIDEGFSIDVMIIWNVAVAGLLALGIFDKMVDLPCCLPVFARARGFNSPFEALLLYFELRRVFSGVILLLRDFAKRGSREPLPKSPVGNFVDSLKIIVQSDISTPEAKLRLIQKLYLLVQGKPRLLIGNVLHCALMNVIPLCSGTCRSDQKKDLDFDHIATIIERPGMVELLGNIPSTPSKSMCSILCQTISKRLSTQDVSKIYDCFASFRHARKVFLEHMLTLLESTIKVSSSGTVVVRLLKEAKELLCQFDPKLMPLAISIFSYLVENNVTPKERAAFFAVVFPGWQTTCDSGVCVRYEIPHILWKTYESTRNGKGTSEVMDNIQELIERVKDLETRVVKEALGNPATFNRGSIVRCDLERLALHSPLSCEDVALCFHLSCCYPSVHRLTCFNPYAGSGSQMQDDRLIPKPTQRNESKSRDDISSRKQFSNATHHSFEQASMASKTLASLLTPGTIAEKMMVQLRRLRGDDINLHDTTVKLWNSLFANEGLACPIEACKPSDDSSACDNVVRLFLSCLEKAPYFEVVPTWFDNDIRKGLSQHHVLQCAEVVYESCGWKAQNLDKEGHFKIQEAIALLLQEILRSSTLFPRMPPFLNATSCFCDLRPQLESLLCILQNCLPFQITFDLLKLAMVDFQAATTIATIASYWPCKNEAAKLLEEVKRRFEKEGERIHPLCKDFVWSMLEAGGRVYKDSSQVLIDKLEWLNDFHGLDVLNYGLDRLPNWRRLMTADGVPAHVIDNWCVFFLFTPRENISLRDVDAVLDISPTSLQLVANASESIKRCLFSENVFQGTHSQEEISSNSLIKECLRLARFLSELIHILKVRVPEKTAIDDIVEEIVVQACNRLCMSHMEKIKKEKDKVMNAKDETEETEDKKQKEEKKTKKTENKSKKGGNVSTKKKEQTKTIVGNSKMKEDKFKEIEARTADTVENDGEEMRDKRKKTEDEKDETDYEPKIAKDKIKSNNPYRILHRTLKALFNEMFAKQSTITDNQSSLQNCGEGAMDFVLKGSTLPQHHLPSEVYESMLVLMRRWLSGIANKPSLASNAMKIVQSLLSFSCEKDHSQIEKLQDEIRLQILSFPRNQLLLSQLQAAGYNQGNSVNSQDLWASPSLELSCFFSKCEFQSDKRYETKLTDVLRLHWMQWKDLLFKQNIHSVTIDDHEVPVKDLFETHASRVEMEKQVAAARKKVGQIESENVSRHVSQLVREEQKHRDRVTKLYKKKEAKPCSCKGTCSKGETRTNQGCPCKTQGLECGPACTCGSADKPCKNKVEKEKKTKLVAVWENRFLENIKLCSELIPGCYAPNGFHSEKPVICALSVDNRILTVFKEEKGRREEIENVEVKLFDAGLYVYGLHTSGHYYVTDELWAAFYKMLLQKRLVPGIVLSNESPGFHWIKKYVQPVKVHPCFWKWHLNCGIVPPEEDYLDYRPIEAALCPWLHGLSEFLTLTRINVARFRFKYLMDAKVVEGKEQQAREVAGKFNAIPQLKQKLHSLHNDAILIGKLASKLEFAVKKTITQIVMGEWPTTETVKKHIDMRRFAFIKCEQCKLKIQNCKCIIYQEEYATIVLRVCESVQETLLVLLFYVFLVNLFALD
ncbi:uncharacterized protein LOC111345249 [Stylophora pistillata]|nr:uncharacterized protein LOC111345249 [Stylophora pistillata]